MTFVELISNSTQETQCKHRLLELAYLWNKNGIGVRFYRCSRCGQIVQLIDNKPLVNPKEVGNHLVLSEGLKETGKKRGNGF